MDGELAGAKVLPFGLNKYRIGHLEPEQRTFHVFYQMLAGASPDEREELGLDDPDTYALLSSSNCYVLPAGPFSDDSTQLGELRAAFASLGFKAKHVRSIFSVLTAILVMSNITFQDDKQDGSLGMVSYEERTQVVERGLLYEVAGHLGVNAEELEAVLTNRTKWVSHDLASVFLDAENASRQRDSLMRDLYAILFAFVVEMANKKLAPGAEMPPGLQITQIDLPGHQSRTQETEVDPRRSTLLQQATLINASGNNGFDEFAYNFNAELLHSYLLRRAFDDKMNWNLDVSEDGIRLPPVMPHDNSACVELLRGGLLGSARLAKQPMGIIGAIAGVGDQIKGEDREEVKAKTVVGTLTTMFTGQPAFNPNPSGGLGMTPRQGRMFGISHYAGQVSYDATDFIDHNADVFDKQLVNLLRNSQDSFVNKLVSGPALATEGHPLDDNIVVEAQVSSTPLRTPTPIVNCITGTTPMEDVRWPIDDSIPQPVTTQLNATMATLLDTVDRTRVWGVYCIRPNDSGHANSYDRKRIRSQVRTLQLPELVNRRQVDYVAEYSLSQFCVRHALPVHDTHASVEDFARHNGWMPGIDYAIGNERIWLAWGAWRQQEDLIRATETRHGSGEETLTDEEGGFMSRNASTFGHGRYGDAVDSTENYRRSESMDNLLARSRTQETYGDRGGNYGYGGLESPNPNDSEVWDTAKEGPYESLNDKDAQAVAAVKRGDFVQSEKRHQATEIVETSRARRWWIRITWTLTWWIPSFLLKWPGGMKRADIRMAWREKVAICMMIAFACGIVIFYIIGFGKVLCPDMDKAWNHTDLSKHQGDDDYYAAIAGKVYEFTKFYKGQHSDIDFKTTAQIMLQFAGQDLTSYFPPPLSIACEGLANKDFAFINANFTPIMPQAIHVSGELQTNNNTKLKDERWYWDTLQPKLKKYYKGYYVHDRKDLVQAANDDTTKFWGTYKNKVYDISDYVKTNDIYATGSGYEIKYDFLNSDLVNIFQTSSGQDLTKQIDDLIESWNHETVDLHFKCLDNAFYLGQVDFRKTARCTVQNYLLLSFSILLMSTILVKFLAALQLGSKRQPELLDKFVICQVPCYTEGEESLKKTIDSLAVLNYDDKRKLIFIICDGNIIGSGNNRPTPRIVLDLLGVDPKLDPEPLLFKSIGEGSKQLNYGKIYSGLYEVEGHVVPYVVVVKVGKPTETSRPGNRGKRDSQVLLMQYLNRVHFDAPMCPLELEIYHQMRNVIGIDPTFYEYIFQVDADTTVTPDSLNRLISCAADDQKIIGICGETKVANERESWTTMIQVYEYYISHHLTKAFESLFGSVTCLPGCFSVYRIRTADKGRPIIISSVVIDEYAEPNVDTLHKKNLFSLGEDRYLTTLMMKHFPTFKMKFSPDAIAYTVAPSRWNVLLSQRRRWINSTVHNLVELLFLPEMCGFCFFSMRFMVFVDLLGTIILPATFTYLVYLIIICATHKAAVPIISIAMIAAVYGLQAIIFILKREFMLIGWMIVYIIAFPVYSLFLPVYSFWSMDDFSWGNTRRVVGEGKDKTIVYDDEERFEESMIPYRTFKEYEANAWEAASLPSDEERDEKSDAGYSRRTRRSRNTANYAPSIHSSAHSYVGSRQPSPGPYGPQLMPMAPMSTWGTDSMYGAYPPTMPYAANPFNSPAMSEMSLRTPSMFQTYAPSPLAAPRNTMAPGFDARQSAFSMGGFGGSQAAPQLTPNTDPAPTDETVLSMLRQYLNTQDLMTVTKRSAREAIYGLFPNAKLEGRAAWINENIDKILSEA